MEAMATRTLPPLLALALSGCIVLPFGVHVNRPLATGGWGNVRGGLGFAQAPLGQGALDAVVDDAGNAANPVPASAAKARLGSLAADFAAGVRPDLDVGYGARGLYALWEPWRAGAWSAAVTPALGGTNAEATGAGARAKAERGKLTDVNLTALGAWRSRPDDPNTAFMYAGAGWNALFSEISVAELAPAYSASGKDSAGAPTVLAGAGGLWRGLAANAEAAVTFVPERSGRTDAVLTVAAILTWQGKLFNR